jgi:hypothetical protein
MDLQALGAFQDFNTPGFATPVTAAETLDCDVDEAKLRLEALEGEGYVLAGAWTDAPATFGYY